MEDELKIAKQYFSKIVELAYEIDLPLLEETIAALEKEIKRAKDPQDIRTALDEIMVIIENDVPINEENQEIINQINSLLVDLDEEFL